MRPARAILAVIWLACLVLLANPAFAQAQPNNMAVGLAAEGAPQAGQPWLLALHFTPKSPEWHGYWSNPGDAGRGMDLDWTLPEGWTAGDPLYPVPQKLVIGGLMNHVYEGPYTVLIPLTAPEDASGASGPVAVRVNYLACTDRICVPERAQLEIDPAQAKLDPRFAEWRAAIAPQLDQSGAFSLGRAGLRLAIPLPSGVALPDPHVFVGQTGLVDYLGAQSFSRRGDRLIIEIPLKQTSAAPTKVTGILAFGDGNGVRFVADGGDVPPPGDFVAGPGGSAPALPLLLLAALVGGLLLNVMPCVFPILSLKALSLAKAGGEEGAARRDALAYTAGVVIACAGLGAVLLALRATGEQVGWAFQLQEPAVVVALLFLAVAITANFLGAFELPGLSISGGPPSSQGSFATGLLAAFVATPCTGPFMAAALGAALLLPPLEALLLFVALGLGLALPFLAVAFIPVLRRMLPKPGAWMVTFRKWMALPMGLTALALVWLCWRLGGASFAVIATAIAAGLVVALVALGWAQRGDSKQARTATAAGLLGLALASIFLLPGAYHEAEASQPDQSLLSPRPFSETALAEARASGKPVFLWFTADWCVTCKVNESAAIEREATRDAFAKAGVIALRGDFTRRNAEIADFLARHGAAGVPLYLWYAPGQEAQQLPQVLTPDFLPQLAEQTLRPSP